MPYGLSPNTGHGRRSTRYRYAPDLCFGGANYHPRHRKNYGKYHSLKRKGNHANSRSASGIANNRGARDESLPQFVEELLGPLIVSPDPLPATPSGKAALSILEFTFLLLVSCLVAAGIGLCALGLLTTEYFNKAKIKAHRSDLATRKALHVMHDHARHRPPTAEMLQKYWNKSRNSLEGKLLLGSLMGDLAVTVDASYIRGDDGEIIGRKGGIRGWIERNAPDMTKHYKTLMHYKAVADKFRLYCGIQEPDGAEEALGVSIPEHKATASPTRKRNPQATDLFTQYRSMAALHAAICDSLGLIRVRRRTA